MMAPYTAFRTGVGRKQPALESSTISVRCKRSAWGTSPAPVELTASVAVFMTSPSQSAASGLAQEQRSCQTINVVFSKGSSARLGSRGAEVLAFRARVAYIQCMYAEILGPSDRVC